MVLIYPLLDGIAALLLTMIEAAKGYFGITVAKYNTEMQNIMHPDEGPAHTIGFQIPEEEYEDDEEVL